LISGEQMKIRNIFISADRLELFLSYSLKIILLIAAVDSVFQQSYFLIFSAVVALVGSIMPAILSKQWKVVLPIELDLIVTSFISAHFILGELHGFYLRFWWFDLFLHSFSAFIFGLVGFIWSYMLFYTKKIHAEAWFIAVFTVSLAMAVGSVWEIFEYTMDQTFGFNMQKSGLDDTMGDLIVDLIGCSVVGVLGYAYMRTKKDGFIRRLLLRVERYVLRTQTKGSES